MFAFSLTNYISLKITYKNVSLTTMYVDALFLQRRFFFMHNMLHFVRYVPIVQSVSVNSC